MGGGLLTEQMRSKMKVRRFERVEGDTVRMSFLLSCRLCSRFSTTSVIKMWQHLEMHPKPSPWQRLRCLLRL